MAFTEICFEFVVFTPSVLDLKQYVYTRDCMNMMYSYFKSANLEILNH